MMYRGRQDQVDEGTYHRTVTRFPDEEETAAPARRGPSRRMIASIGVIAVLLAAIALVNRGGDSGSEKQEADGKTAGAGKLVLHKGAAPQSRAGAQAAAANHAVALGSEEMFSDAGRRQIVQTITADGKAKSLEASYDAAYKPLAKRLGLTAAGKAPEGSTFVNRTTPIGSTATKYSSKSATVDVWCMGLFGIAGNGSKQPVSTNYFTLTLNLQRSGDAWQVVTSSQKDGPTPIAGDNKISDAKKMGTAAEKYGRLTYGQ